MKALIIGFLGRANGGDEAMVQVLTSILKEKGVDEVCYMTEWIEDIDVENEFYKNKIFSVGRGVDIQSCDLIIIGGGYLRSSYGFLVLQEANLYNIPVLLLGTSYNNSIKKQLELNKIIFGLFDGIVVRDLNSKELLKDIGIISKVNLDIAHKLEYVLDDKFKNKKIVVVRQPDNIETLEKLPELEKIIKKSEDEFIVCSNSPCDDAISKKFAEDNNLEFVYFSGYEPSKLKGAIVSSNGIISFGRYHPVVYAISLSIPFIGMDQKGSMKITNYCANTNLKGCLWEDFNENVEWQFPNGENLIPWEYDEIIERYLKK